VVCCSNRSVNLAAWAERTGVARVTAYRWFRTGLLPVPARKVGRLILVDDPSVPAAPRSRTAVYARVSSADQKADLDRQVAPVTAWATTQQIPVDKVVTEVDSALNGRSRKFLALLRDPSVTRIVSSTGTRSAVSVRSTSRPRWPHTAESWWSSTPLRLTTTWCGI
jgi:predicted site-specific integrase-resolvase